MAYTSKYGFIYKRHLLPGVETPATLEVTLANSAGPITVGDAVKYNGAGYLVGSTADYAILGVCIGFVTEKGENIFKTKETIHGTIAGDDTYTAASDNVTVHKIKGVVVVDQMALFQAYADSALTAAECGLWFDGVTLDGTYADGVTGTGAGYTAGTQQWQLIELVTTLEDGSASTTTGLFRIGRSQLINDPTT